MAGDIKDYLPSATADYTTTQLDVAPQRVLTEEGDFRQRTVEFDDVSSAVLTKSTTPVFYFRLQWPVLGHDSVDADKIIDFFFDTAKGKARARTFEFPHPTDGNTYIVRFWSKISREIRYLRSIPEVVLKVEGYKA